MTSQVHNLPRFKYNNTDGTIGNHPNGKFTSFNVAEHIIRELEKSNNDVQVLVYLLEQLDVLLDQFKVEEKAALKASGDHTTPFKTTMYGVSLGYKQAAEKLRDLIKEIKYERKHGDSSGIGYE